MTAAAGLLAAEVGEVSSLVALAAGILGIAAMIGAAAIVVAARFSRDYQATLEKRITMLMQEREDERVRCVERLGTLQGRVTALEEQYERLLVVAIGNRAERRASDPPGADFRLGGAG